MTWEMVLCYLKRNYMIATVTRDWINNTAQLHRTVVDSFVKSIQVMVTVSTTAVRYGHLRTVPLSLRV